MDKIKLYRKRLIPEESIYLKDDVVIYQDPSCLITRWKTIKPKPEMDHGISCYFLNKGFKVSKFYKKDGSLLYWYCDIIYYEQKSGENTFEFTDLLIDVILYENGFMKIVDLDEFAEALDLNLISLEQIKLALKRLDSLLSLIYNGGFHELQEFINTIEQKKSDLSGSGADRLSL